MQAARVRNEVDRTMTRIHRAILATLGVLCAIPGEAQAADAPAGKRNIIFILTDDQRFDLLGCMGHPFVETPNLDALARNGILFQNAFVTTSLCSPSRASILSGQYAHTHGVLDNQTSLPDRTPIFPSELRKGGYRTAYIGKWHMGGGGAEPHPAFDRWVSFRGQGVYRNPTFYVDGVKTELEGYVTDLLTDYAVEFIRGQSTDQPFMLYVSHKAVHAEFQPAERHEGSYREKEYPFPESMKELEANYRGKPKWVRAQRSSWHGVDGAYNDNLKIDKFVRLYAETLRAVDDGVGRIVDELRAKGMLDSTLILFTSDNGFLLGEHGLIDKRAAYEPSIRVPLIAHCPELFAGGARRGEMILNIDYAPTILEAAGVPVPESVQGRSFYRLLTGEPLEWRKSFLYEYFWEDSFPHTPTVFCVRTERYKFMRFEGVWDVLELYDLQKDPDERNNLLGEYAVEHNAGGPDMEVRRRADEQKRKLHKELGDELERLKEELGVSKRPDWRERRPDAF
jgi:N-acetylglucosamine-6-sulfatase